MSSLILLGLTAIVCVSVGGVDLNFFSILFHSAQLEAGEGLAEMQILRIRLIRVGSAALVGAGLALSGAVLQRLLRNPLADPFVLGISSGGTAAVGTVLLLNLAHVHDWIPWKQLAAFAGCLLTIGIVFLGRARMRRSDDAYALPVIGLILNSFFSAYLMMSVLFLDESRWNEMMRWMMGSLQSMEELEFISVVAIGIPAMVGLYLLASQVDVLVFGDEFAKSIGISVQRVRNRALLLVAVLVSLLVAVSGSVGFVGLLVPHFARKAFPRNPAAESGACLVFGAFLVMVADALSRTVLRPTELPLGIFTAFIGAPVLTWLLLGSSRQTPHLDDRSQ